MGPSSGEYAPFRVLPAKARERLAHETVSLRVPRGARIFAERDPGTSVFILRSGRVTMQRGTWGGGGRTLCVIGPGQAFCCLSFLDGAPYPGTATAAVDSLVDRLPRGLFCELLESHPEFARASLAHLGRQLREAGCGDAPVGDAGARLAARLHWLLLVDKYPPRSASPKRGSEQRKI